MIIAGYAVKVLAVGITTVIRLILDQKDTVAAKLLGSVNAELGNTIERNNINAQYIS